MQGDALYEMASKFASFPGCCRLIYAHVPLGIHWRVQRDWSLRGGAER